MSFVVQNFAKSFNENSFIDDFVDRTHRNLMVAFLVVCSLIVASKQYVGSAIACVVQDRDAKNYANSYCWAASTYQILPDPENPDQYTDVFDPIPGEGVITRQGTGIKAFVSYYQWIPLVLCVQAIFFFLPYLLWRNMSKTSGIHLVQLLQGAHNLSEVQKNGNAREFFLKDVGILLTRFLRQKKKRNSFIPKVPSLLLWFAISKVLYLLNVAFQLGAMHSFLKTPIIEHGLNLFKSFIFDMKWLSSTRFPIRTICNYKGAVQLNGHVLSHQTHCVLPINLYNDKIYGVIALLFLMLTVFTVFGILQWLARLLVPTFSSSAMFANILTEKRNEADYKKFRQFLGLDGYFILLLVEKNVSTIASSAIIDNLFVTFQEESQRNSTPVSISHGPPSYNGDNSVVKRTTTF